MAEALVWLGGTFERKEELRCLSANFLCRPAKFL
jgi:hypothetical protein